MDDLDHCKEIVRQGLAEREAGQCAVYAFDAAIAALRSQWDGESGSENAARETAPTYYPSANRWLVAWTENFSRDTCSIDRKLLGRVFEAIAEITRSPMTMRGNTVKPLSHALRGCWRIRIGDYRLVYHPQPSDRVLVLIAFSSRTDAYPD